MNPQAVIVGSGLAGTFAALQLSRMGVKPTVIDVGYKPSIGTQNSLESLLIGDDFEGLKTFDQKVSYLPPRLLAPRFQFVSQESQILMPMQAEGSMIVQSTAFGGLANAWGAGVFRYDEGDLKDFPFSLKDIEAFYDSVSNEIGISGSYDDLTRFFGKEPSLQEAPQLSRIFESAVKKYELKKQNLNRAQFYLGRPRLAVLTSPMNGREAVTFDKLEFLQPHLSAIYTPAFTLERLIREDKISYIPRALVSNWNTVGKKIEVVYKELDTGIEKSLTAEKIFIGAGTINSTKILAKSLGMESHEFNLIDNPGVQIPLFAFNELGRPFSDRLFGSFQLSAISQLSDGRNLIGNILDLSAPSRSTFFGLFPLPASKSIEFIRNLVPAMAAVFVFGPGNQETCGKLKFEEGIAKVKPGKSGVDKGQLKTLIWGLRSLGLWTHSVLVRNVPFGGAIHYAGTTPMRQLPLLSHECGPNGRLKGKSEIFMVDAAGFPCLPAKNHSFTLMANAMRIAKAAYS